jgi:ribosomal protein S18 acetylase RimI-like enzyme
MRPDATTATATALRVRPFEPADLDDAAAVAASAFGLDLPDAAATERWRGRVAHAATTDPDGAFVAVAGGRIVGAAEAVRRERLWCLSLLTVLPGTQSAGAGRALLGRALGYARDADAGLIVSSSDPRALRLYGRAGFSLRPTFRALGTVDRRRLPRPDPTVREIAGDGLEALEPISRAVRVGPHTPELRYALGRGWPLLAVPGRGFAVAAPEIGVWLLVARDDDAATALLWSALERVDAGAAARVGWITGEQAWAVDVVLRAGLELSTNGALCVRGRAGTLRPYLPSAPFG